MILVKKFSQVKFDLHIFSECNGEYIHDEVKIKEELEIEPMISEPITDPLELPNVGEFTSLIYLYGYTFIALELKMSVRTPDVFFDF